MIANTRGWSPESLWVQRMPRCECEIASPDSSVAAGADTVPVILECNRARAPGARRFRLPVRRSRACPGPAAVAAPENRPRDESARERKQRCHESPSPMS